MIIDNKKLNIILLIIFILALAGCEVPAVECKNETIINNTCTDKIIIIDETIPCEVNDCVINDCVINESLTYSEKLIYIKKIKLLERRIDDYLDMNETGYYINLTDSYHNMRDDYADCLERVNNCSHWI